MLFLIASFSGESHRCPLAFSAAARPCRIVQELIGAGFSTKHYTSQLVQRHEHDRFSVKEQHLFADAAVQRAHVITVKTPGEDGDVPASLVAANWWFAWHPQHVPVSLLFTSGAMLSLDGVRGLGFARRVETLYVAEPKVVVVNPEFLAPLATFVNLRKACDLSQCGDVRWMLSCPHLASVAVQGYNRPTNWNAGEVVPYMPALQQLILYEGGVACLSWLPLCTKLTTLALAHCNWLESCDAFATMPELTSLQLGLSPLADISGLANCPKLTTLDIGGQGTLSDGSVIGTLRHLKQLTVSRTGIKDVSWIDGCEALEEVTLDRVQIEEGFDSLGKLSSLRKLSLQDVRLFPFQWVSAGSRLEEVSLDGFGSTTAVAIENLRNARMLKKLRLPSGDSSNHEWVPDCIMLEELGISCESNATHLLHRLFSLPRLRDLKLRIQPRAGSAGARGTLAASTCGDGVFALEKLQVTTSDMQDADDVSLLLQCISLCTHLKTLTLDGVPIALHSDASWLAALASLQELYLGDCEGSATLNAVGTLTELREISLQDIHHWPGFSCDWTCRKLQALTICSCRELADLSALRNGVPMNDLGAVVVADVSLTDLSFLAKAPTLQKLTVRSLPQLTHIADVASCRSLQRFCMERCACVASFDGLQSCTSLTDCVAFECAELMDVDALSTLTNLTTVTLRQLPQLSSLSFTPAAATSLQELNVSGCPRVASLCFLQHCQHLNKLWLFDNPQLEVLPPLDGCASLSFICFKNLTGLRDLSPLVACGASLQRVELSGCNAIANMETLSRFPHLRSLCLSNFDSPDMTWVGKVKPLVRLMFSRCTGAVDYSSISQLTNLQFLALFECSIQDVSWIADMPSPPLESVEFSRCPDLDVSDPAALPAFVRLR